jgi:hypothetical protein
LQEILNFWMIVGDRNGLSTTPLRPRIVLGLLWPPFNLAIIQRVQIDHDVLIAFE